MGMSCGISRRMQKYKRGRSEKRNEKTNSERLEKEEGCEEKNTACSVPPAHSYHLIKNNSHSSFKWKNKSVSAG